MKISGPIVVVDDDDDDHYILKEICNELDMSCELLFFSDGLELINFLRTSGQHPFLILCDINLPQMNGLEVRRLINDDDHLRSKSIPFVFFSTASNSSIVKKAYEELTVQGFFVKGNTYAETERKLRNIIEYWSDCKHPRNAE